MKALSLHQPWASAIALGSKRVETRHWATQHRGPLAIHAAKHMVKMDMAVISGDWVWRGALGWLPADRNARISDILPFGAIVATCMLTACRQSESFTAAELKTPRLREFEGLSSSVWWTEEQMGNFGPGRYGWVLEDVKPLEKPIPFRGLQGLFNVPDALLT